MVEGIEKHYSVDDLVEAGVFATRATGWAWCRDRKIRHLRIGGAIIIPESAVREFLDRHTVEPSSKRLARRKCKCGKLFPLTRANSKYCSDSCKGKYGRSRRAYGEYEEAHQALLKVQRQLREGKEK